MVHASRLAPTRKLLNDRGGAPPAAARARARLGGCLDAQLGAAPVAALGVVPAGQARAGEWRGSAAYHNTQVREEGWAAKWRIQAIDADTAAVLLLFCKRCRLPCSPDGVVGAEPGHGGEGLGSKAHGCKHETRLANGCSMPQALTAATPLCATRCTRPGPARRRSPDPRGDRAVLLGLLGQLLLDGEALLGRLHEHSEGGQEAGAVSGTCRHTQACISAARQQQAGAQLFLLLGFTAAAVCAPWPALIG